jgi:PIN domain nuclease of toxin-antitoxin system
MNPVADDVVLDASAILAYLGEEPGAERVEAVLSGARVSAVNLAEIVGKLAERGASEADLQAILGPLNLTIDPFEEDQAWIAGAWRPATKAMGLSLADRACLALAASRGATAYTTDRRWAEIGLGVTVEVVR